MIQFDVLPGVYVIWIRFTVHNMFQSSHDVIFYKIKIMNDLILSNVIDIIFIDMIFRRPAAFVNSVFDDACDV